MDLQLNNRTCLITGASTGIGAGIAKVLAGEGAKIAMVARRADLLEQVAAEIREKVGVTPITVVGDITVQEDIARIIDTSLAALTQIDILVNSAGGSRPTAFGTNDEVSDEALALNFTSIRHLTEAVIPAMRSRRWGRIINITGNILEQRSLNAAAPAKAALHTWAKVLSREVAADGITINSVPPGRINSEQILNKLYPTEEARREFIEQNIPIGYFGEPEDIAYLVAFLCSPLAHYITDTTVPVDGGMSLFPF